MKVKDLVAVMASTTIVSICLKDDRISKTASDWHKSNHEWLEREVVQFQIEAFLYNTISVLLNHVEDKEA